MSPRREIVARFRGHPRLSPLAKSAAIENIAGLADLAVAMFWGNDDGNPKDFDIRFAIQSVVIQSGIDARDRAILVPFIVDAPARRLRALFPACFAGKKKARALDHAAQPRLRGPIP